MTRKRRAFVEAYLQCWNASEAARRAGYAHPGSQGHRLLKNVEISAAIEARLADLTMSANEVLTRLTEQARGIESGYFVVMAPGEIGLDFDALKADGKGHLIKACSYSKDGELTRVEFYDAQGALALLGKYHKLFTDKVEHSGGVMMTWRQAVEQARQEQDGDAGADHA